MKNILIDLSALKAGGGCTTAANFLHYLNNRSEQMENYLFLKPDVGPLASMNKVHANLKFVETPSHNPVKRVVFESFKLKKLLQSNRIDTIYTFFGAGLPHPPEVKSIVTVAYPIICYDESVFWKYVPKKYRIRQRIINSLRISRLKDADLIIVETDVMCDRLARVLNKEKGQFLIIPPSPSDFVEEKKRVVQEKISTPRMLFLSGVAYHKNLWRLPELAAALQHHLTDFKFVISTGEAAFTGTLSAAQLQQYNKVSSYFEFLGTVRPEQIGEAYRNIDLLVSLSDLESFSNNYMEAWKAGVPLIVSDRDFSRHICKDSALYIEPHDATATAAKIAAYLQEPEAMNRAMEVGKGLLKLIPNTTERTNRILQLLKDYA